MMSAVIRLRTTTARQVDRRYRDFAPADAACASTTAASFGVRWEAQRHTAFLCKSPILDKRKSQRLDGDSPYRCVLPKISLVGRRSAEPQASTAFPIFPLSLPPRESYGPAPPRFGGPSLVIEGWGLLGAWELRACAYPS